MANDCLVTKYKKVVNNDNLLEIGQMNTNEDTASSFAKNPMFTTSGKVYLKKGRLKNTWTKETFEPGVMYDSFGTIDAQFSVLESPIQLGCMNKYVLKSVANTNLSELKYSPGLENILRATIDVSADEANAIINSFTGLKTAIFLGEVSPAAFQGLNSLITLSSSYLKEGEDMSVLPPNLRYVYNTNRAKMHWLNANPRTGYICAIREGVDFGNDLDNYLISNAAATLGKSPSATDEWSGKKINVYGTRTSASDSAVATLKSLGLTVVVNDETL
jgi:hypothetical protein